MVDAVLFTRPDPRTGPAATDLFRVRGGAGLVLAVDGAEWRYPNPTSAMMRRLSSGANVDEVSLLRDGDAPLSLASIPDAIAAAVVDSGDGWIFWFDAGQCARVDRCSSMALARSEIEGCCLPAGGYELFSNRM